MVSITSAAVPNKYNIAATEDAVNVLENEEADRYCAKISLTLQSSKVPNGNLSKDECKALKESQSYTSILVLPADKGRYTAILSRSGYLEMRMDHINNGPYQTLKKILPGKTKPRHWNNYRL